MLDRSRSRDRSKTGRAFSPAGLFANNEQGAWYDPSDFSTLYQTSTGTTPVTAVEQPVGLMLDRSRGLVLGPELLNGSPTAISNWTYSAPTATFGGSTPGDVYWTISGLTIGQAYCATASVSVASNGPNGQFQVRLGSTGTAMTPAVVAATTSTGEKNLVFIATETSHRVRAFDDGTTQTQITNFSLKALPGNHALQATSTSRPVLRARYNLLTYSEQFDNAGWQKGGATVTANAGTAPDGTMTADRVTADGTSSQHRVDQSGIVTNATQLAFSIYAKAGTAGFLTVQITGANCFAQWNLSTGAVTFSGAGTGTLTSAAAAQSLADGWWRLVMVFTQSSGSAQSVRLHICDSAVDGANPTTSSSGNLLLWGAQLLTAADQTSTGGAYQRIAAATDYDTSNPVFRPYLAFDGTDDSFGTSSIDFSATDEMTVFAGVSKLSDAARGAIAELTASAAANNGAFLLAAPNAASATFAFESKGTALTDAVETSIAAPTTAVLTGIGDISGDVTTLRRNGTQRDSDTGDQGTGNYANAALFIGRRNNTSLPFNGRLYSLAVLGRTATAAEIRSTEQWVAGKTGVPSLQLIYDATNYLNGIAPYHWFDFVNDRALYAGVDVGGVSGATGYSLSRASTGYYENADGTLTSFASGELRRGTRGVLIEGARTNLLLQSGFAGGGAAPTSWVQPAGTGTSTPVTSALNSSIVAYEHVATAQRPYFQQTVTIATNTTYVLSVYVEAVTGTIPLANLLAVTSLPAGAVATGDSLGNLAAGQRRTLVISGTYTGGAIAIRVGLGASSNVTGTVRFSGPQLEAGAFPSSYIPTTTASATRAADVLTCTAGVTAPCALFAEFESYSDTSASIAAGLGRGTADNEWTARIRRNGTAIQGGTSTTSDTGSTSVTIGSGALTRKAAYRAAENDFALSVAGGTVSTDVSGVMPAAPTQLVIGSGSSIAYFLFGYVTRVAVFNSALSDANLQTVTT